MIGRAVPAMFMAVIAIPVVAASATHAAAERDRSLKLFFTHTGERATITFKREGKFDPGGLAKINRFPRDWRKNEPAKMDPRLLDLVWEVCDRSGATDCIHIVSAYRSRRPTRCSEAALGPRALRRTASTPDKKADARDAVKDWALSAPGAMTGMTAPLFAARMLMDGSGTSEVIRQPVAEAFDNGRFWSDG